MTGRARRGLVVAGGAVLLLAAIVAVRDEGEVAVASAAPSPGEALLAATGGEPVADLRLERLSRTPVEQADVQRNLFRFRAAAARQSASVATAPRPTPVPRVAAGSGPPSVQPIPLRYIGLVEAPSQAGRLGVFSDGRGNVFHAQEGDIIEGRYLVSQVGAASAELSHLDGRGRQTIRLSGQ